MPPAVTVDNRPATGTRQLAAGATGEAQRTDQTLAQLGERLAVIDATQMNIADPAR